ncbi:MAG: copper homeostasis protein CutC [Saprospiraceae bacterium]|nr:copper homeostasis protein CutC [Saprospiraceae bacterium]
MLYKEACVDTIDAALSAEAAGAHQIEWCSSLELDGLTPDFEETQKLLKIIRIPVKVMIRHRPGDFIYDTLDENILVSQAKQFSEQDKVSGLVFGACTPEGSLDIRQINNIAMIAGDKSLTIHKAIDTCKDILTETTRLNQIPGDLYILSSGGHNTAWDGRDLLLEMKALFKGQIIAAGKIDSQNLVTLHSFLTLLYYHGRKIV